MAVYADVEDVRDRWEGEIPPGSPLEERIQTRLDDAEAILIQHVNLAGKDLAELIAAGRTTERLVTIVLCDMICRLLRNASGVSQESAGPFARTFDAAVAAGKLFLIKEDKRRLGLKFGASSISLSAGDDALADPLRPPDRFGWIA